MLRLENGRLRLMGLDSVKLTREVSQSISIDYLTGLRIVSIDRQEEDAPLTRRLMRKAEFIYLDSLERARYAEREHASD